MFDGAMRSTWIHRAALAALAIALVLAVANIARAQTPPANDRDTTRGELDRFDTFLDNHPAIDKELKANPSLVNDPNYISQHPELKEFLHNHPGVREELKENPQRFMNRERRLEHNGGDINRTELRNFDNFLDKHPGVEKDLRQNPKLADDPNYLASHPELKEFLNNHPGVRGELREHPAQVMNRERRYEKHENAGKKHPKR